LHTHTAGAVLDFTRKVSDGAGGYRLVDDKNAIADFEQRLKAQAAVATMGPGSLMARLVDGRWVGDPDVVARSEANDRYRANMQAQMQARMKAAGINFAGPYDVLNSVK
jgi:hypothetical protein